MSLFYQYYFPNVYLSDILINTLIYILYWSIYKIRVFRTFYNFSCAFNYHLDQKTFWNSYSLLSDKTTTVSGWGLINHVGLTKTLNWGLFIWIWMDLNIQYEEIKPKYTHCIFTVCSIWTCQKSRTYENYSNNQVKITWWFTNKVLIDGFI